jgi:succinylglutamate desuccinylase
VPEIGKGHNNPEFEEELKKNNLQVYIAIEQVKIEGIPKNRWFWKIATKKAEDFENFTKFYPGDVIIIRNDHTFKRLTETEFKQYYRTKGFEAYE